ncbi:hypothetical protein Micbo1qcDRAFT_128869 [Microdochium bolleyi]|uniref:Tat pathway signal sequence n=1 Tax=Microdochium bolleyi TaxID=196109 RepID=A0A136IJW9_9PEZI|nr:hypothetical protein Micbo1qcDRAFT_128869 [Microdochium bolleyi]
MVANLARSRGSTDQECVAQLSVWSPAIEAVEYIEYNWGNEFNSTSKFRGPPTPELEQAWTDVSLKHGISVPQDKLSFLNRTDDDHVQHIDEDPTKGYTGLLEVFHQLHCLNLVRQYTWLLMGKYQDMDTPTSLTAGPVGNRMHADHCIETLRLALMCQSDITPVLVIADPSAPIGNRADFNSYHKCRNFGKIEAWMDENWTTP